MFLSFHYVAGLWRCGAGCLCAHLLPHGMSSGRTPCVSWPGRGRGGAQVAGAFLSVGLARFVVVDASCARKAMTQDLRDLGMIISPRLHIEVIRRGWVCRAVCLGDVSGGGGERLGRPGPAPTRWMALCPFGRWIPGALGSPPGWSCCAVSSSSGALTAGRRLPGGLLAKGATPQRSGASCPFSLPTAFGPWSCRVWAVFARRPHYG